MPKLTLKFNDRVMQECPIGTQGVRIGRLPDNTVVIDNPAVSGRHARVFKEGDQFVVEDLQSTNGTFVNEKPVTRQALRDGDVVLVGKHSLVFDLSAAGPAAEEEPELFVPELGGTVVLDTLRHKTLLAKAGVPPRPTGSGGAVPIPKTAGPPASTRVGMLHVLAGRADQPEYTLSAHTSLIGRADTALVRLKGWFKPKVAVAVARKGEGYTATRLGGKPLVNGERLRGRHDLKDGDVIDVGGLTLEFRLKA